MAYRHMRSERTSPRYLGPRDVYSAPPTVNRGKRRVWHNFVDYMFGRRKEDHRGRRRSVPRSTTHPQGFILPPYAFQSMGYPPPPPQMAYGPPYGVPPPHPMAYMPPPPPRAHDLNDRTFMDPEFYSTHPESDLRSEYSHQSGSTRPGSHKNYSKRDNRNKQPPFAFSGASPQEIEEYEAEPPPALHRKRLPGKNKMVAVKDEEDDNEEEEEETINSPIKGFDSFMMY